jgi:hypothetical protein
VTTGCVEAPTLVSTRVLTLFTQVRRDQVSEVRIAAVQYRGPSDGL